MITFLNPIYSSLDVLDFLYGRFFGQVAFCISSEHLAKWNEQMADSKLQRPHWLLVYDGYSKSKDDRCYECWGQILDRLKNTGDNSLLGALGIMDDVLINLWNFNADQDALMSKIWSMNDGGLFVPEEDLHARPFFIGNLRADVDATG